MAKKKKTLAGEKRARMSQAQQMIILAVMLASVVVGAAVVLAIHSVKYIGFYKEVIIEKDASIENYAQTLVATGACTTVGGELTDEALSRCNPEDTSAEAVPGTLKYNVMEGVANNPDLEAVEGETGNFAYCYDDNGRKIDYSERYDAATTAAERKEYLARLKACSALRIVPDALPAQENEEALMASLNQIFNISGWEPDSLSPSGAGMLDQSGVYSGLGMIPVSFSVESSSETTLAVLNNLERSIRTFDIQTATIEWASTERLNLRVSAVAYYTGTSSLKESNKTVYAKTAGGRR